jgi:hypothetical protein
MARLVEMICPTSKVEYFLSEGWTVDSGLIGLPNLHFWRNRIYRGLSCVPDAARHDMTQIREPFLTKE